MTTPSRESIERTLQRLNDAENSASTAGVEVAVAGIDSCMAADVEGWHADGTHSVDREIERAFETRLFGQVSGYRRVFDAVTVDPPKAAVAWRATGRVGDSPIQVRGASFFEFDDAGLIRRFWLYHADGIATEPPPPA